jgi:small subunit ribosomal protein S33
MSTKRFTPAFTALIDEAARKCFGTLPVVNYRTGFKALKQKPIGPMAMKYYLPTMTRTFKLAAPGEFKTDLEDRRDEKLIRLKRRGKGPPKKGQGKRSKKKNKK